MVLPIPSTNKLVVAGAIIIIVLAIVFEALFLYAAYKWGAAGCQTEQAQETVKQQENNRKADAKIDKQTPTAGDRRRAVEWLLKYTVD